MEGGEKPVSSSCMSPNGPVAVQALDVDGAAPTSRVTRPGDSDHLRMEEIHADLLDSYHRESQAILVDGTETRPDESDEPPSTRSPMAPREKLSETPDSVQGELAFAILKGSSSMHRSASLDRRLSETAQFLEAVGESPPIVAQHVQQIIEDDNDDSDEDDANDVSVATLEISLNDSPVCESDENRIPSPPRRLLWPFQQQPRPSHPFHHSLPGEVRPHNFVYRGIHANPPEVTKRGITRGNYSQLHRKAWLEVSDKKHRYGKNLRLYYREWERRGFPATRFFDWLDSEHEAEGWPKPDLEACPRTQLDSDTVLYIKDDDVTKQFALTLQSSADGRGRVIDADGQRVSTGSEGWIFVLRDNELYGARKVTSVVGHSKQRFHHSSFFGGKAVSAAGILISDGEGVLTQLLPHSGHYRPGEADMQRMLLHIHRAGVDLRTIYVDTQQLNHINRQEDPSKDIDGDGKKKKKIESLNLQTAASVAHYLSHKARMIDDGGGGVFSKIHMLGQLESSPWTVEEALDAVDEGGYWKNRLNYWRAHEK